MVAFLVKRRKLLLSISIVLVFWLSTQVKRPRYTYLPKDRVIDFGLMVDDDAFSGDVTYVNSSASSLFGFQVKHADIKFLPHFKSPCFLELPGAWEKPEPTKYSERAQKKEHIMKRNFHVPADSVYRRNPFLRQPDVIKGNIVWRFGALAQIFNGTWIKSNGTNLRLRCLPRFLLTGVAKSGTTDFCHWLTRHPQLYGCVNKESFWWHEYRFTANSSLSDYSDLFDSALRQVAGKVSTSGVQVKFSEIASSMAVGECSSMLFYNDPHWIENPVNANLTDPAELTIHHIRKLIPSVKLLVILRNPVTRLYSHYKMSMKRRGPSYFHETVERSIHWWRQCIRKYSQRACAYGSPPGLPQVRDQLAGPPNSFWKYPVTPVLREGLYFIFAQEWLKMFPSYQILFIKLEEYSKDRFNHFKHHVFPFLGVELDQNRSAAFEKELSTDHVRHSRTYQAMWKKTETLLNEFYQPYNDRLAALLENEKWLWKV